MSGFIVDFTPYDVVVLDYAGDLWSEQTKANFVNYVKNGGGLVVYHACPVQHPRLVPGECFYPAGGNAFCSITCYVYRVFGGRVCGSNGFYRRR